MKHGADSSVGERHLIAAETLELFWRVPLARGSHKGGEPGVVEKCGMEMVAWLAGLAHSDLPNCTPRTVATYIQRLNDRWGDKRRQRLKPYRLRVMGLDKSLGLERKRAFMAADAAVREFLPFALESRKVVGWPEKLRALPPIIDASSARAGPAMAREARADYAADYAAAARARADALALALLGRMIEAKL